MILQPSYHHDDISYIFKMTSLIRAADYQLLRDGLYSVVPS